MPDVDRVEIAGMGEDAYRVVAPKRLVTRIRAAATAAGLFGAVDAPALGDARRRSAVESTSGLGPSWTGSLRERDGV